MGQFGLENVSNHQEALGVPTWSLSLSKNYRDFELSFLGILVFRGTSGSIRSNFDPVSTNSGQT